jgi:hypothetical protein
MLRKLIQAGAIVALLTGAASAQMPMGIPLRAPGKRALTPQEIEKQKAIDNAYRSATKTIPNKPAVDPWGNVRPNPATGARNKKKKR